MTALEPRRLAWSSREAIGQVSALVDLDPDLGRDLPPHRWDAARRDLPVRVATLDRGPWSPERARTAGPGHLGVLIVDGLLARELLAHEVASSALGQLTRRGEVIRRADGTWLLTGTPVGAPDARTARFIPPRRAALAAAPEAAAL